LRSSPSAAVAVVRSPRSGLFAFALGPPLPDDATLRTRATYDAIALRFLENARDRSGGNPWIERFATGLPAGALVVDLGAGPGIDAFELRRRGLRAFSLDFSMGMLRAGVEDYPGPRLQGDARRLPFRAGALAGIWASASLLHLARPDAVQALEDAHRALAPSGRLLVTVKQGHGCETETTRYGMPRFFQYWTGAELDAVLDATRFRVIDAATETLPRAEWLVRLAERID
jgi:SAM-dependent methyltransferase